MAASRGMARRVGLLYFVFALAAVVREFLFPAFTVPGDAAATARNIVAAEGVYRVGVMMGLGILVLFLFLVWGLHALFRDVDRRQAMLMVILVLAGVALSLANLLNELAPLILLSGADWLAAFTRPQLEALAMGFLRLHGSGGNLVTAFWGLWLFPFGLLVIRSGWFPKILGYLLFVAGFAYVASCFIGVVLPAQRALASRLMMPLYFGEVPIILWLMIMGAKVPQPRSAGDG